MQQTRRNAPMRFSLGTATGTTRNANRAIARLPAAARSNARRVGPQSLVEKPGASGLSASAVGPNSRLIIGTKQTIKAQRDDAIELRLPQLGGGIHKEDAGRAEASGTFGGDSELNAGGG